MVQLLLKQNRNLLKPCSILKQKYIKMIKKGNIALYMHLSSHIHWLLFVALQKFCVGEKKESK